MLHVNTVTTEAGKKLGKDLSSENMMTFSFFFIHLKKCEVEKRSDHGVSEEASKIHYLSMSEINNHSIQSHMLENRAARLI